MTILVFDLSEDDRAEANARAFDEGDSTTFLYSGKGRFELPDLELAVDLPRESGFSVLFLHDTDEAKWEALSLPEPGVIVRYTGGEIPESEGEHWIRQRSIIGKQDALSPKEAQQIVSWANEVLQGEDAELPPIMQEPANVDHLSALSILCQGYLAVHAEEHGDEKQVSKALNDMGWSDDLMTESAYGQTDKISNPGWWMKAFDGTNNLKEKVKNEWGKKGGWSKVEDLLDWITEEQEPRKGPKPRRTVAAAYSKLAERLGGIKA